MAADAKSLPAVFPWPQRMAGTRGLYDLGQRLTLACEGDLRPAATLALFNRITGLKASPSAGGKADVRICVGRTARAFCRQSGLAVSPKCFAPEGYALEITPRGITIAAGDDRGCFYAMQSLRQIAAQGGTKLPCLAIRDWPRFPLRGVHVFMPAREDLPFFKRFIEFLARYKFNTMFLEIGGGMQYMRHPEINEGWERLAREAEEQPASQSRLQNSAPGHKDSIHIELGGGSYLTQDEVRRIVRWCAAGRIEIIPEVQSLSHSYYLLANHRELAENPKDRWPDTCCPSNPKTYELLFDVMQEVIDVFGPKTVSIGHDEVYTIGFCPRCKGKDLGRLLADEITRTHDFLAERGIRTAMWSEKLHHNPGPAKDVWRHRRFGEEFRGALPNTTGAFDRVPRDILLLNWYNSVDPQIVRMLRERGFTSILGNYGASFYVDQVRRKTGLSLDELLKKDRQGRPVDESKAAPMLGAEVSTWCAPTPANLSPYLFLANQLSLWTRELTPRLVERMNADLIAIHRREGHFLARTKSVLLQPGERKFRPVSIAPVADVICDGRGRMWGGFGNLDLRRIPAGKVTLGGVPFEIIDYPRTRQCPFIGVDANVRNSFPVPVGVRAKALVFLHTSCVRVRRLPPWCSLQLGEPVIAAYEVTYADGKKVEVPVIHQWNIGPAGNGEGRPPTHGDLVWRGRNRSGGPLALYAFEWVNPRPRAQIDSIMMIWKGGYLEGDVVCGGITAVS